MFTHQANQLQPPEHQLNATFPWGYSVGGGWVFGLPAVYNTPHRKVIKGGDYPQMASGHPPFPGQHTREFAEMQIKLLLP